ncbi:MAG: hypothetical protein MK096_09170 [Oleiphilaceae bacterium]|nr:hypothetical protein [Oleiphilaceae bacterium]
MAIIAVLGFASLWGYEMANEAIEVAAGEAVEQTLSSNTITQLKLISEVEQLIQNGNLEAASAKLKKSKETHLYILSTYCALPKCKEAVNTYGP